ncbi:MAG TPA: hypothetical protein VGG83_06475 [Trebonia sp.]
MNTENGMSGVFTIRVSASTNTASSTAAAARVITVCGAVQGRESVPTIPYTRKVNPRVTVTAPRMSSRARARST